MKYIKNVSGGPLTVEGQVISDSQYYQILSTEEAKFSSSSTLLSYIGDGSALMAKDDSGASDIADVNTAIDFLKNMTPSEVEATLYPFAAKALPNGKKLYKRKHGVFSNSISPGQTGVTVFVVPYLECKITETEVIAGQLGDKLNFRVLDTVAGTLTGTPSSSVNQFGFDVYITDGLYRESSNYDADLFQGLQLEIEYTNMGASSVTPKYNITLHEIK